MPTNNICTIKLSIILYLVSIYCNNIIVIFNNYLFYFYVFLSSIGAIVNLKSGHQINTGSKRDPAPTPSH